MWRYENDNTSAVITAKGHINSSHKAAAVKLPETAVLFYMHGWEEYITSHYKTELIANSVGRFLKSCPVYKFSDYDVCFLDGGRGAPQAVDTIETLKALGVKNVVSVGMFGAFAREVDSGDIVIPSKAFVEEGTSLHYYSCIECAYPDALLCQKAMEHINGAKAFPLVSTDAVYRQTFYKEELWRNKGAVGVDMETSALYSVGKYLGLKVVSILIASDKHPLTEEEFSWKWKMTKDMRYSFFDECIKFALNL
ncbi:MAG: nucleoside phosphorylase [Clostridium sp.]|nr:nucleoside phosphorylase [Clostridium sp.]